MQCDSPRLKSVARRAAGKAKALKKIIRTVLDCWQRHSAKHPHHETLHSLHALFSGIVTKFASCTPAQATKAARDLGMYRLGIVSKGAQCLEARVPADRAGIMVCYASKYSELSCSLLQLLSVLLGPTP